jgi:hypothetical protein
VAGHPQTQTSWQASSEALGSQNAAELASFARLPWDLVELLLCICLRVIVCCLLEGHKVPAINKQTTVQDADCTVQIMLQLSDGLPPEAESFNSRQQPHISSSASPLWANTAAAKSLMACTLHSCKTPIRGLEAGVDSGTQAQVQVQASLWHRRTCSGAVMQGHCSGRRTAAQDFVQHVPPTSMRLW